MRLRTSLAIGAAVIFAVPLFGHITESRGLTAAQVPAARSPSTLSIHVYETAVGPSSAAVSAGGRHLEARAAAVRLSGTLDATTASPPAKFGSSPASGNSPAFQPSPAAGVAGVSLTPDTAQHKKNDLLDRSFKQTVNAWIHELAEQPGFESWKQADWTSTALGAGMHGWVVLLTSGNKEVGYLIVSAVPGKPDQYQLAEYGSGPFPLFSLRTLDKALHKQGLLDSKVYASRWPAMAKIERQTGLAVTPVYINPFYAFWLVQNPQSSLYFDAKTGELYPVNSAPQIKSDLRAGSLLSRHEHLTKITHALQYDAFNPFDRLNWVTGPKADFHNLQDVLSSLNHRAQITVTSETFHGQVMTPFALTGYHQWNEGEPFLALDQEGPRYIPYSQIAAQASFYLWDPQSSS